MKHQPKTTDQHYRNKWRQLHFLIGVQRSQCKEGEPFVIDSAMEDHVYSLATHEAVVHAVQFYGETQIVEYRKRFNEVLDYFTPADNTITRNGLPLRRA